jgi:hypothetical protein
MVQEVEKEEGLRMAKGIGDGDREAIRAWLERLTAGDAGGRGPALDYPRLGAGKHRVVYDLGDGRVLKVALVPKGIECNSREASLYRKAPPDLKKHLCPVLAAGPGWLAMKKMTKKVPKTRRYAKRLRRIQKLSESFGVRISDLFSRRTGNPRRNNIRLSDEGRIVLIDYANVRAAEDGRILSFLRRAFGEIG